MPHDVRRGRPVDQLVHAAAEADLLRGRLFALGVQDLQRHGAIAPREGGTAPVALLGHAQRPGDVARPVQPHVPAQVRVAEDVDVRAELVHARADEVAADELREVGLHGHALLEVELHPRQEVRETHDRVPPLARRQPSLRQELFGQRPHAPGLVLLVQAPRELLAAVLKIPPAAIEVVVRHLVRVPRLALELGPRRQAQRRLSVPAAVVPAKDGDDPSAVYEGGRGPHTQ
mmetsp:Transcript_89811/g.279472  ORF Transcript_89811/g.279472 Transcript_89811/m.279472 type:complete len:231 (-) Transcript_89811:258-950(-)